MSLHYSIPELKSLRSVYKALGILNSPTLKKIDGIIVSSYFTKAEIQEIIETTWDFQNVQSRSTEPIEIPKLEQIISKSLIMEQIIQQAELRQKREVYQNA